MERFEETVIHELYINLWGLTPGWVDSIIAATLEECRCEEGEEAEGYRNPACMAVRFRTLDSARIPEVRRLVQRLLNLAKPSTSDDNDSIYHYGAA